MKSLVIIGGGESGVGAALLAKKYRNKVFVSDYGIIPQSFKDELKNNNIPFEEGGHTFEKFDEADLIIISPGIPAAAPIVVYCRSKGKEIISEIAFASRYYDGKIIGVTGSNGKTTTVSLIYHLIKNTDQQVALGGNIGLSFSRILSAKNDFDWLVLELSSFQLDYTHDLNIDIGVILNITADHLDRYDYDISKYAASKWILAKAVKKEGHLILNNDDEWITNLEKTQSVDTNIHWLSAKIPEYPLPSKDDNIAFEIQLKGRHNHFNATVAVLCAQLFGMTNQVIQKRLRSFQAIEHRLESVAFNEGVEFINDSKATNVDSAMYALEAVEAPVIWIAGGTDKGNDYASMIKLVEEKVKVLICLTRDDSKLRQIFGDSVGKIFSTQSMDEAIEMALAESQNGDKVLLSPACASFDLFNNYEHRGKAFKESVLKKISDRI